MHFSSIDFAVSSIELPKAKKVNGCGQAAHLSEEELSELLNALPNDQWRTVFAVAYFTGARISEVLKLKASAVRSDRIVYEAQTTKTKTRREAIIIPQLRSVLDEYGTDRKGFLFTSRHHNARKGSPLSRQAADKVLRDTCKGLWGEEHGVSTHSFRRSFATNLAQGGKPMAAIQRLLGHKDVGMTSRYVG